MHYLTKKTQKNGEDGISPVVGVMLMLVVTIIIAAVVSAFAGGSVTSSHKSPNANLEIHIRNGGTADTSYFSMTVLGVSEPIPTKNLKIYTSWQTTNKDTGSSDEIITGGGTSDGTSQAKNSADDGVTGSDYFSVPTGYGNGVGNVSNDNYHTPEAEWGSFILTSGTTTFDRPDITYGSSTNGAYNYASISTTRTGDPVHAILGPQWNNLRAGDSVSVRIIDVKSGKTIVDQDVMVEG